MSFSSLLLAVIVSFGTMLMDAPLSAPVIDSARLAQQWYQNIYDELQILDNQSDNLDDYNNVKGKIIVCERNFEDDDPIWKGFKYDKKVYNLRGRCISKLEELTQKGVRLERDYEQKKRMEKLNEVLDQTTISLDSLLEVGRRYVNLKKGDSVKFVKEEADRVWNDNDIPTQQSEFKNEESLKNKYQKLVRTREDIARLSEKTAPKIGDILLKIAIAFAAIAIISGMVGAFVRGKKLKGRTDDTPTFEL